jgi:hypothetical protein
MGVSIPPLETSRSPLVDIDALAAAAIAASVPSRNQGGEPAIIREVDVGAFR